MCRWADGMIETVNPASSKSQEAAAPLKLKFGGSSAVLLFGERNMNSGKLKITLDGKPLEIIPYGKLKDGVLDLTAKPFGGNVYCSAFLASGLDATVEHEIVFDPLFEGNERQVVRLESLCLAGPNPQASISK